MSILSLVRTIAGVGILFLIFAAAASLVLLFRKIVEEAEEAKKIDIAGEMQLKLLGQSAAVFDSVISKIDKLLPKLGKHAISDIKEAIADDLIIDDPERVYIVSHRRLINDSGRLIYLSLANLIVGILFCIVALYILADLAFQPLKTIDSWSSLLEILPRVLLSIFLQIIGFFFLRLYVSNQADIKHNKNELTNIDSKMMAYYILNNVNSAAEAQIMAPIAAKLMETERNFIVKSGEKSVYWESATEYNDIKSLFEKVIETIGSRSRS